MQGSLLCCLLSLLGWVLVPVEGQGRIQISTKVRARYAVTTVKAPFKTGSNPEYITFEAELPLEALISGLSITANGLTCQADVEAIETASEIFYDAEASGFSTALTELYSGENSQTFRTEVRVKENSEGYFRLTYEHQVRREDDDKEKPYVVTIPMTTSNYYDHWAIKIDVEEDNAIEDEEQRIKFQIDGNIISDSFTKNVRPLDASHKVYFYEGTIEKSEDSYTSYSGIFTLSYNLDQGSRQLETFISEGNIAALISPNAALNRDPGLDILVLLDTSGSMADDKKLDITLEAVVGTMLKELKEENRITFIEFNSDVRNLGSYTGSRRDRRNARRELRKVVADGWTDLEGALAKALEVAEAHIEGGSTASPLIILYTDGKPQGGQGTGIQTDQTQIQRNVKSKNGRCIPIYSMAIGAGADYKFVRAVSIDNCGQAYEFQTDGSLADNLEKIFEEVKVPIFSTLPQIKVESDCIDETKLNSDLKKLAGKKFANSSEFDLVSIPFLEGVSLRQPCEVGITYAANVKNKPIQEEVKICFPEGRRRNRKFTKLPSVSQPCPPRIRGGPSSRVPREDFIGRLREYRDIKEGVEALEDIWRDSEEKQRLVGRAKDAHFVIEDLTALVVVVQSSGDQCEIAGTRQLIKQHYQHTNFEKICSVSPPLPSEYTCKLTVCDKANYRGACYNIYDESFSQLSHDNGVLGLGPDEIASMRIESGDLDGPCPGYILYTEEGFAGDRATFGPGDYPGFRELGEVFQETRSLKTLGNIRPRDFNQEYTDTCGK